VKCQADGASRDQRGGILEKRDIEQREFVQILRNIRNYLIKSESCSAGRT
jgi:hypothetical protein